MSSSTNLLPETWKFWVILNAFQGGKKIYQIEEIFAFNTVEAFWSYTAALPPIADFRNVNGKKVSLALFRGEIRPAWEDKQNENGATYSIIVPFQTIEEFWETIMLYVIGGQMQKELFDGTPEICGLFVKCGQGGSFIVELWTKSDVDRGTEIMEYIHKNIVPADAELIKLRDFHTHKSKIQ
jgi:hypothetical protein